MAEVEDVTEVGSPETLVVQTQAPRPKVAQRERWLFSFGCGDIAHSKVFVIIPGTYDEARAEMLRRFDRKWCGQYLATDEEIRKHIEEYRLTELPLNLLI